MNRLLKANFYRLKKNKMGLIMLIFTLIWAFVTIFTKYISLTKYNSSVEIELLIFNFGYIFSFIMTIFCSLFLGDNGDNTTRMRIISGNKKRTIYIANFITVVSVILGLFFLYTCLILVIGIPLFGEINIPISTFILKLFNIFLIIIAITSLYTFIGMVLSDKVIVTVLSIILYLVLMFVGLLLVSRLSETEYMTEMVSTNYDTHEFSSVEVKNPLYVPENVKKVIRVVLPINPFGAYLELTQNEVENLQILPLYSLGIIILFNISGLILFSKKEFK